MNLVQRNKVCNPAKGATDQGLPITRYRLGVGVIVVLATLLRFVNYASRWGLAHDQSLFAILSRYALLTHQAPVFGPYSSAGPFQTGGQWLWLVMVGTIWPHSPVILPWIWMTMLSVVLTIVMIRIGTLLINRKFGLLLGLLSAVSPVQITQSVNLSNQTPLGLFAAFVIIYAITYIKSGALVSALSMGLWCGIAMTVHLQGAALGAVVVTTLIIARPWSIKKSIASLSAAIVPWAPLVIRDSAMGFINTKAMVAYICSPIHAVSYEELGRRWSTFLTVYMPQLWASISGGWEVMGYLYIFMCCFIFSYLGMKKKLSSSWWMIGMSCIAILGILRYTRTPLYDSFVVFFHPFVYVLTGFCLYHIWIRKRYFAYVLSAITIIGSIARVAHHITTSTNYAAYDAQRWKSELQRLYPGRSFDIYDWQYNTTNKSLPLVLYLQSADLLNSDDGIAVGLANRSDQVSGQPQAVWESETSPFVLYNISDISKDERSRIGWAPLDPEDMYRTLQHMK